MVICPCVFVLEHIQKLANIVFILNYNRDIDNGTSYRLISLLSVIAKTLEKIADTTTQHSIVMALHTLNKRGYSKWLPPARTITVAIDMSKAFDTINIHTLIRKLIHSRHNHEIHRKLYQGTQSLPNIQKPHIHSVSSNWCSSRWHPFTYII